MLVAPLSANEARELRKVYKMKPRDATCELPAFAAYFDTSPYSYLTYDLMKTLLDICYPTQSVLQYIHGTPVWYTAWMWSLTALGRKVSSSRWIARQRPTPYPVSGLGWPSVRIEEVRGGMYIFQIPTRQDLFFEESPEVVLFYDTSRSPCEGG